MFRLLYAYRLSTHLVNCRFERVRVHMYLCVSGVYTRSVAGSAWWASCVRSFCTVSAAIAVRRSGADGARAETAECRLAVSNSV